MGHLQLSHRRHVHHGSSGLLVAGCSIGAVQEGALSVDTQVEDEFVEVGGSRESRGTAVEEKGIAGGLGWKRKG